MMIRVLCFAAYRDLAGTSELMMELPEGSRVGDLVSGLRARGGGWSRLPERPAVAVNMEYADPARALSDGDEVALIPPVSGGRV